VQNIKPDILLEKKSDIQELKKAFIVLKVTNKISKTGKDIRWVFDHFDKDKSGHCKLIIS
jgi:Ca2+-binding EF-hand superfamily protein